MEASSQHAYAIVAPHLITDTAVLKLLADLDMGSIQVVGADHFIIDASGDSAVHIKRCGTSLADWPADVIESWERTLAPRAVVDIWQVAFDGAAGRPAASVASKLFARQVAHDSGGFLYDLRSNRIRAQHKRPWWKALTDKLTGAP